MSQQDFETLSMGEPSLLALVEGVVLNAHREVSESSGAAWSRNIGYRWLRYEDPLPVDRLAEGVEKLVRLRAQFDGEAVEKACAEAVKRGFSN